ncbi:hypothetical protein, partial [Falsiroseomonas oryzae]|uniref:hypothetical protein n=1 Tax=Falsiroseomonas oryzae TaxID=2766473 RepID=UPI0022EABD54
MPAGFLVIELAGSPPARPGEPPAGPAELLVGGLRMMPPVASLGLSDTTLVLARTSAACAPGAPFELRRAGRLLGTGMLGAPEDPRTLLADRPAPDQEAAL